MAGFHNDVVFGQQGLDIGAHPNTLGVRASVEFEEDAQELILAVNNTSTMNSSHATIEAVTENTASFPIFRLIQDSSSWAFVAINSGSPELRLFLSTTTTDAPFTAQYLPIRVDVTPLSAGGARTVVNSGMAIASGSERSGGTVNLFMVNSNPVANSNVTFNMQTVAGGGFMAHAMNGVGYNWQWGNNAPVDQNWQLLSGVSAAFGVGTQCMVATQAGEVTFPNTPAFNAQLSAGDANVTGAGATYNVGTNVAFTEIFDQGGDFNTNGTFTAPITGRYQLNGIFSITALTAAMTTGIFRIVTSNRIYTNSLNTAAVRTVATTADTYISTICTLADMDAGDTAILQILILGGAGNTAGLAAFSNKFSGFLQC